jgi:hypothetical protein
LEHLDQKPLHGQWKLDQWYYVHPPEVRQTAVRTYLCPARRGSAGPTISIQGEIPEHPWTGPPPYNPPYFGAVGDYAACAGDNTPMHAFNSAKANGSIVLGGWGHAGRNPPKIVNVTSQTRLATLSDGLSNTFLIGEKHVPLGKFGRELDGDGSIYNGDPLNMNAARVAGIEYPLARFADEPFKINFGSYHEGICQFMMADGSLRPISTTVSGAVLSSYASRDDGRITFP